MAQFQVVDCDNIRETFTGAASTTVTLGGAAGSSHPFSSKYSAGDTFWGTARIIGTGEECIGLWTYNGTTCTIGSPNIWKSSNGGSGPVTFSLGGAGEIFVDPPGRLFDHLNMSEITVTSAATTDIGAAQGARVAISGTTGPITSFGTSANKLRIVRHSGSTITHNASFIILLGGVSWTTSANDMSLFVSDGSGVWRELMRDYADGRTRAADGTVGAPGVTFASDPDTGLYRIGANNIGIAANGAKVVDIGTAGQAVTGTLSSTGVLSTSDATASTSASTGALKSAGGIGAVGDINWGGAASTAYTPTVTATTGTFTTVSATGRYKQHGKQINYSVVITITTIGTAAGRMKFSVPVAGQGAGTGFVAGYNSSVSKGVTGTFFDTTTDLSCILYDGTFPGASGATIYLSGWYEAA